MSQKNQSGEVALAVTLLSIAVVATGILLGTQRVVRDQTFRMFGFAAGEKVRLHTPLSIVDRGDYYLLSSSVCFTGLTVPSNPGRYYIHTVKKPDGNYGASTVEYVAPQTSIPYCGTDTDSSGKPKANWRAWDFTMKILKTDTDYLCRGGLLFTSSSAFAVNEKMDLAGNDLSFICKSQTPTPVSCPINLTAYLKEHMPDGTLRDMTEIVPASVKWYAINDQQLLRHGSSYNPSTAAENWYGFGQTQYGGIGGKFIVNVPNVTWPIKAASDDSTGHPYVYQKGAKASVKLVYDKDNYEIESVDPGPGTVADTAIKDTVGNLLLDCDQNYAYGWVMKKKTRAATTPVPTGGSACTITGPGWVDADRTQIKTSSWFTTHKYGDCKDDNTGFWPPLDTDCLIADQLGGPTGADKAKVNEPPSLYYKHLTPGDVLDLIPKQAIVASQTLDTDTIKDKIRQLIIDVIKKDPRKFSTVSMDSVAVGLENGRDGTKVRSLSLWVHPTVERIVTDAITIRERARLLYQPFIEGATGQSVSLDDVTELYTAALNKCGSNAIAGDKSGLGTSKRFGDYTAIVQDWTTSTTPDDIFSNFRDCNIHIVRSDLTCRPVPPPAGGPTTGGTGGSGGGTPTTCVLRDTDHAERCRVKNVDYKLQSSHTVRVSWDRMNDPACEFDVYNLDIVRPSGQGDIICHRSNVPKNENEGEAKVSVRCDVRADTGGTNATISDFKYDVQYTANVYLLKNQPPGCFSKGGHKEFTRNSPTGSPQSTSAPQETSVPQSTQTPANPTSFPPGKTNRDGNYDAACCATDGDCPSGQKCSIGNGGCRSNQSCNGNSNQPTPIPPQAPPPSRSLSYTIEIRNNSIRPVPNTADVIKKHFPEAVTGYTDAIMKGAIDNGWNPAFILAIWMEETGASTTTKKQFGGAGGGVCRTQGKCSYSHLGCNPRKGQNIDQSLLCIFEGSSYKNLENNQFEEFAKNYCGPNASPICSNNKYFLGNLGKMYDELVTPGTAGSRRILTLDINDDGIVNALDYARAVLQYGKKNANIPADVDGNLQVNSLDLSIILSRLGERTN